MRFEYMRVEEGSAIIIDAENMEVTEIGVNGCPGHLYISVDPEQSNCITWYDNGAKMQFIIDGFLEGNELQKMAASVLQELSVRQRLKLLIAWLTVTQRS